MKIAYAIKDHEDEQNDHNSMPSIMMMMMKIMMAIAMMTRLMLMKRTKLEARFCKTVWIQIKYFVEPLGCFSSSPFSLHQPTG